MGYMRDSAEDDFKNLYKKCGYQLTKRGYPDFLVFRENKDTFEFLFAEIKVAPDTLSKPQKKMIALMRYFNMPVNIIYDKQGLKNLEFMQIDKKKFDQLYKSLFRKRNAIYEKK